MKTFNLEQALAGKPVITRNGREAKGIHIFEFNQVEPFCLYFVIDDTVTSYKKNGCYKENDEESAYDLFMAPEKITKYGNFYLSAAHNQYYLQNPLYDTEQEAKKRIIEYGYVSTIPITFEI